MTIFEIRDKLINDEIDYSAAFEYIKKLPKPWHTKEWKLKRDNIINSECEQCKYSEGIMVAQHLIHPTDFKTIRKKLFNSLFKESLKTTTFPKTVITKNDIKEFHNKTSKLREACPHCEWIRIRKRKTMKPEYFCDKCKVGFKKAIKIEYNEIFKTIFPNEEQVTNYLIEKKEKEIIWEFKQDIYVQNEKELGKRALLISIDHHLKYMELEYVLTFCKKCAAKMDLEYKLLCWKCKTNYFNYIFYECCYKCYERNEITLNPIKHLIWKLKEEGYN